MSYGVLIICFLGRLPIPPYFLPIPLAATPILSGRVWLSDTENQIRLLQRRQTPTALSVERHNIHRAHRVSVSRLEQANDDRTRDRC
jgi:hypothetical protein